MFLFFNSHSPEPCCAEGCGPTWQSAVSWSVPVFCIWVWSVCAETSMWTWSFQVDTALHSVCSRCEFTICYVMPSFIRTGKLWRLKWPRLLARMEEADVHRVEIENCLWRSHMDSKDDSKMDLTKIIELFTILFPVVA